jgi:glutathione synthase
MKMLFLMDPLDTVDYRKDTTFAFMLGASRRGHDVYYLPIGGIHLSGNTARFDATPVVPRDDPARLFDVSSPVTLCDGDVDTIFIRNNPPFDAQYLMNTWLLDPLTDRIAVINDPRGVRGANEKLWAMNFPEFMPPTLVTRSRAKFQEFLDSIESIVAKPTDGFGGLGVFVVRRGDANAQVIFETLSDNGRREIVLQGMVPEATQGDKRILLLNGELLGAVMRVQGGEDHRNNFFAGAKPEPAEVTGSDREIIAALKPRLIEQGLYFAGIDILGDRLIEVNVTSPTCLQEINRITGDHLEDRVVEFAESLSRERRTSHVG